MWIYPAFTYGHNEIAIIVNDADPLSVKIGDYYRKARRLPEENIIHIRFEPARAQLSPAEFAPSEGQRRRGNTGMDSGLCADLGYAVSR